MKPKRPALPQMLPPNHPQQLFVPAKDSPRWAALDGAGQAFWSFIMESQCSVCRSAMGPNRWIQWWPGSGQVRCVSCLADLESHDRQLLASETLGELCAAELKMTVPNLRELPRYERLRRLHALIESRPDLAEYQFKPTTTDNAHEH